MTNRMNGQGPTRETFVRKFFKDKKLPFPVAREEYLSYYSTIEGYEAIEQEFNEYIEHIEEKGYQETLNERDLVEEKMLTELLENEAYKQFLMMKIEKKNCNVGRDLYKEQNVGKRLLSIDIKNANFFILYKLGIVETPNYSEWISKFTNNSDIVNSKYLRLIILGKLNNKRLEALMKNLMVTSVEDAETFISSDSLLTFNKDEVVYDVSSFTEDEVGQLIHSLSEIFENCSFEQFTLKKTAFGYVKEFSSGEYSFHTVPKDRWLENYKLYKGLKLEYEDKLFLNPSRELCLRLE